MWIEKIREDLSNRISNEETYAGGKIIDVSKILKNFGVDNTALGLLGALLGREPEGRLLNEGINSDFTHVSGETRTHIILHESSTGKQLAFNAQGHGVQPNELIQLVGKD